ncbi:ammonium transporter [Clostridium sp. E02]|uniref:ammonium transporter n=1 Tax=Clostridium sp. E02 TaxID=2487134 RepID=UPI000F53DA77|nr:ammonium transporter [Clostridium sp. E02]
MSAVNTIWVLVGAALVFFMQAGFAMVEAGFTRAKNSGNIIMKNVMDFCIGTTGYWFVGFGIMFGSATGYFGGFDFFIHGNYTKILPSGISLWSFVLFQTVFCATAATIVSGAMAERTKFSAYCVYSAVISCVVYPISGHWIWGGGWLAQLGFHDFAGSTAVHMVGGVAAVIGASILGPRIGKYTKDGKPKAILGHSITLGALGVFILWFCWFGFNGGSTLSMEGDNIEKAGRIFMTTNLAAAVSTCTTMLFTWFRYKKPDVSMTLNGTLAGLVAITAGCDVVTPTGAALIGLCAGFAVVLSIEFIDAVVKIDDPVGAIGVHGVCGALGTILVGFFAKEGGLFYGGGGNLLGIQLVGVLSVAAWVGIVMFTVFQIIDRTVGLRVTKREEIEGLDSTEHGLANAYADFLPVVPMDNLGSQVETVSGVMAIKRDIPVQEAIPIKVVTEESNSNKSVLTKIEIIAKQSKFEELKTAMNEIGVTGMTVTQVLGCGIQKGAAEYYRGVPVDMMLLPKVQVEIVVAKVPAEEVVRTARKVLYTGHIGDGKIFIYDVRDAVKVRTGETGYDAMQGVDDI